MKKSSIFDKKNHDNNTFYKIGQVSKLVNIRIETLRYYDSIGLLKPTYVEPTTLYRYYSVDDLNRLSSILMLRRIGVSIKDVNKLFQLKSSDAIFKEFDKHITKSSQKIQELQKNLKTIQNAIAIFKKMKDVDQLPYIYYRKIPTTTFLWANHTHIDSFSVDKTWELSLYLRSFIIKNHIIPKFERGQFYNNLSDLQNGIAIYSYDCIDYLDPQQERILPKDIYKGVFEESTWICASVSKDNILETRKIINKLQSLTNKNSATKILTLPFKESVGKNFSLTHEIRVKCSNPDNLNKSIPIIIE